MNIISSCVLLTYEKPSSHFHKDKELIFKNLLSFNSRKILKKF